MNPVISIKNLEKYYGARQVLRNISLDVYAGQVLGYIGPNGAGKSTTVKILCGLISDFTGSVSIKGIDMKEYPVKAKAQIGYVPELAELYDVLTPMEFLTFMGNLYEMNDDVCQNRIVKLLAAFGLENNMNRRMESFSKGMKQKVLIASGILHNPDIIILDEPLSGLDANSVIMIKDLISRLAKEGKTIFYCSHMMDVVEKVSDRIILINGGDIVADGSIQDLKREHGDKSLEQIFSDLTNVNVNEASSDLINALN